jgi:exonuclease SbcC
MTIKYIKIKNFQSWKDIQFDLHSGINVFVGVSNKGKSAVARAIRWVATNQPSGDEFISDWGTEKERDKRITRVDITFDNDVCVSRLKGKYVNEYRLSTLSKPLVGFGKGEPPQEVLDAFNMSNINIQEQDDPYFLFSESPPEIGRRLNKVASLSDIDVAFKNVASSIKSVKGDKTACQSSLKSEQERLLTFEWIDDAEALLGELETKSASASRLRTFEMNLRNIKSNIELLDRQINEWDKILLAEKEVTTLIKKIEYVDKINNLLDILEPVEEQLNEIESTIKETTKVIKLDGDVKRLLNKIARRQSLLTRVLNLKGVKRQITQIEDRLKIIIKEEREAQAKWDALPDVCPLCGAGSIK